MNNLTTVPALTIIFMFISIFLCILIPTVMFIVLRKKTKASIKAFVVGILTFIVFSQILEQICHYFFLIRPSGLSIFVTTNPWVYILYGALAAGLFEETGRFVAFKFFLKNDLRKENSLAYGIGHGGIEAVIVGCLGIVISLIVAFNINSVGLDNYVLQNEAYSQIANTLLSTPSYMYLVIAFERFSAIILHISLSVLVYTSVKNKKYFLLYPLAIILHTGVDIFAVMYQQRIISNIFLLEALVLIYAILCALLTYYFYKRDNDNLIIEKQM